MWWVDDVRHVPCLRPRRLDGESRRAWRDGGGNARIHLGAISADQSAVLPDHRVRRPGRPDRRDTADPAVNAPRIVIAGAGTAGHHLAATLRESGFDGAVSLIGDEPHLPYHRPPLSKDYLVGT